MTAAASAAPLLNRSLAVPASKPLHVLTLAPFYPSSQDVAEGCFIAEPLSHTGGLGIRNEVIAVQPAHRRSRSAIASDVPGEWKRYFALPGNVGLPSAGVLLAVRLKRSIRELQRTGQVDVIHAHAALPCGHAAALLADELGIPFVVSVHGLDAFFDRQAGLLGGWSRRICERIYQTADAVICISKAVEKVVKQRAPLKTAVVYNGVDPNLFCPGAESDPPVVLSVGNLIPIKGQALLLRAFSRLSAEFPRCELRIVGEGPERGSLQQLASSLGIGSRVRFPGRMARAKVAESMRQCAVFALPSEYEGLGCVYLEAMAAGKPVIGCHGQGIAEVIEHGKNGLLLPPRAEAELADSLRMLLRNRDIRGRMGSAARATVLDGYTLSHQAQQFARIYRECAR